MRLQVYIDFSFCNFDNSTYKQNINGTIYHEVHSIISSVSIGYLFIAQVMKPIGTQYVYVNSIDSTIDFL